MINQVAQRHGVDEKLVQALIKQESGFNPNATSKTGAMGLMQLMPSTAKSLGVKDPYNATQNVEGGVKYLKSILSFFKKQYKNGFLTRKEYYNAVIIRSLVYLMPNKFRQFIYKHFLRKKAVDD